MPMSSGSLVRRFYSEVWNRSDEAVAYAILHDDFRFRGSLGSEWIGPAEFVGYVRSVHTALAGYTCMVEDLIESGLRVAARMRFTGTHAAPFFGVPASGRQLTWSGAAFFTVDGRRITELWVLGDIDGLKQQLGAGVTACFTA